MMKRLFREIIRTARNVFIAMLVQIIFMVMLDAIKLAFTAIKNQLHKRHRYIISNR